VTVNVTVTARVSGMWRVRAAARAARLLPAAAGRAVVWAAIQTVRVDIRTADQHIAVRRLHPSQFPLEG
jgi:hypothetical protein